VNTDILVKIIGIGRLVAGALAWFAPRSWGRSGFTKADDAEVQYFSRLFGSRDLWLGGALLAAPDDATRRRLVRAGFVVDGMDLAAAVVGRRRLTKQASLGGIVIAGAAVAAAGLIEAAERRS